MVKTNGDVPTNLTAWIKGDLENTEEDDFVSEDEEVLPAQITKDLEDTNQDDSVIHCCMKCPQILREKTSSEKYTVIALRM